MCEPCQEKNRVIQTACQCYTTHGSGPRDAQSPKLPRPVDPTCTCRDYTRGNSTGHPSSQLGNVTCAPLNRRPTTSIPPPRAQDVRPVHSRSGTQERGKTIVVRCTSSHQTRYKARQANPQPSQKRGKLRRLTIDKTNFLSQAELPS